MFHNCLIGDANTANSNNKKKDFTLLKHSTENKEKDGGFCF